MSFSMDGVSSYLNTTASNALSSANSSSASNALGGLSSESTKEELTEAVKSFESYMVEQVVKTVRDSIKSEDEDEDEALSQYTDYYMDATIAQLSETMVDEYGSRMTDDLVAQMKRNYGIE